MTQKNALVLKKGIKKISKTMKVESFEQITFSVDELKFYRDIHKQLKQEGTILSRFEDEKWSFVIDEYGSKSNFIFDLDNNYFNWSLKGFVLLKISNGISVQEVRSNYSYINKVLRFTNWLDENEIEKLEEYISSMGYRKKSKISISMIEFLRFNNYESCQ